MKCEWVKGCPNKVIGAGFLMKKVCLKHKLESKELEKVTKQWINEHQDEYKDIVRKALNKEKEKAFKNLKS